ncbi:MAG: hypothetical protein ACTHN5_13085 [Phycisphaerae bacterium]
MRWRVHGTDAATGQPVMLAVDEMLATDAVQAALSKRIIVSHVTREGLRRALFPLACAVVVVMIPLCAAMYWYQERALQQIQLLQKDQARLTTQLTESETAVRDLKAAGASLVDYRAVLTANEKIHALEQQLTAARAQVETDNDLAARLDAMNQALAASRQQMAQLQNNITEQVRQAQAATAAKDQLRVDALDNANRELAGQIDTLKAQLLLAAANSVATAPPKSEEDPAPAGPVITRWALRTSYDAASDFVALHFDKDSQQVQPQGDGTVLWTAMSPANASMVRVLCDNQKRRVYSVSLTVSLAPDAPKAKLDENLKLVVQTLTRFAPSLKHAAEKAPRLAAELADKNADERMMIVGDDTKLTVWNNGSGAFTWRIESRGTDAGE